MTYYYIIGKNGSILSEALGDAPSVNLGEGELCLSYDTRRVNLEMPEFVKTVTIAPKQARTLIRLLRRFLVI
jgi:hypothetical protein